MAITIATAEPTGAAVRMDRLYRHQRHIYDFTRKYYLLGRDRLINQLSPRSSHHVLEIGCGTGRNLIRAAKRYPNTKFYGVDVSAEMLATAEESIARAGLSSRVTVARADATAFDPTALFGRAEFQRVFISYSLSMIPEWRDVLDSAFATVALYGEMHIVDFGAGEKLPRVFNTALRRWLKCFHVIPCDDLENTLKGLAAHNNAGLLFERPFRGYAQYAMMSRI